MDWHETSANPAFPANADMTAGMTSAGQDDQQPADSGASVIARPGEADVEREQRVSKRRVFMWTWVLLTVLYFSWEAAAYRGIFAYLTEWQFDHIGQDLPTFTFGLLTTLVSWPALRLFRRKRSPREEADAGLSDSQRALADQRSELDDSVSAVEAARDFMHYLGGFTAALLVATVAALLWTLALPRLEGQARSVAVTGVDPGEGPAELVGTMDYGRIASFSRGILFLRRSELYAPILPPDGTRRDIRYFVEFSPEERGLIDGGSSLSRRRGILVRNDLPGALVRLYRYLGYYPASRYYTLYASSETIRWPFYMIALQFALGAAVFLLAAALQGLHVRRLLKRFRDYYGWPLDRGPAPIRRRRSRSIGR